MFPGSGLFRPCLCHRTPVRESHPTYLLGTALSPAPHESDPTAAILSSPLRMRSFSSPFSAPCRLRWRDCSARLHIFNIPYLYLILAFLLTLGKHNQIYFLTLCLLLYRHIWFDKFFKVILDQKCSRKMGSYFDFFFFLRIYHKSLSS